MNFSKLLSWLRKIRERIRKKRMTVEIEEVKLQEMEEDLANYVKVIKRYDEAVTIKDELIKRYENELSHSKDIIIYLLKVIKEDYKNDAEMLAKIDAIISDVENTMSE